ncbi:FG-GAP-like repeat-containing protein [Lysobacter sp. A6]|uniref:FG-GAP-like repeat-containing protein n=1 Tax=Noviluteimonas lactosilytica TaxID=2888523 RepID=A0ABS8JEI2_9GAMM|nr:FG-GAP-like repeat-containing protein [Lysobacter lactosilyticus]MCC8362002.1 FG-GAP-like repeat-containing protein [Lysobacter lactosilyticus]
MGTQARKTGRRFGSTLRFGALAGAMALVGMIGSAQATFHLVKIVEIFPGTAASPNAQYIVLQMYANGENLLGTHRFTYYNAAGQATSTFTFPSNVANGMAQAKILIATPEARTFFNVQPDFTTTPQLLRAGGKICYADTIDCVAWGNYTAGSAGVGVPFNATGGGLLAGRAVVRRLDIFAGIPDDGYGGGGVPGSTTTLEGQDDTDNSANDFRFGTPAPRNNAGQVGTVPAATCGNGRTEGLEQCDDGNTLNGDACNSTCAAVTTPTYRAYADFNNDGRSDLPWRHTTGGYNTIWRSANAATQQGVTTVPNVAWRIVGVGDFDNNGQADLLWRNSATGTNLIWRGANAATQTGVSTVGNLQWKIMGVGDFNADRRADIVWRNDAGGFNTIWLSGNGATQMYVTSVTNLQWRIVAVADFNRDGRSDLLWRNTVTGGNVIWRSGSASLPQAVGALVPPWQLGGVGDFNGDGIADIFWRNGTTGGNVIWLSGNAATRMFPPSITNLAWRIVAIGDYNGDRKSDVLWRNQAAGSNTVWLSGNAATQMHVSTVSSAWGVVP